ncbi:hypothetical protein BDBG_09312 [Blastomyces gilchristii SLH14081]|uniref:Uncharacterized protein n=1 Tax=Blastomyces gilchristii (strain SLH14081) TaxID=559298 RepID=A0A179V475_BLAGS|nr:uncharacterized protein BDBG_09312 [Blastomyces gilchristii SLH14081]OAT14249.1 hypothetical protein BDBG_09312 [Blastomyces gilchristii SLH14081]
MKERKEEDCVLREVVERVWDRERSRRRRRRLEDEEEKTDAKSQTGLRRGTAVRYGTGTGTGPGTVLVLYRGASWLRQGTRTEETGPNLLQDRHKSLQRVDLWGSMRLEAVALWVTNLHTELPARNRLLVYDMSDGFIIDIWHYQGPPAAKCQLLKSRVVAGLVGTIPSHGYANDLHFRVGLLWGHAAIIIITPSDGPCHGRRNATTSYFAAPDPPLRGFMPVQVMRTEYTASTKSCSCVSSTRVARLHRGKLDQPKIHDLLGFTTPWVPSFIPPQERNSLSQDPYLQCYVRIQIFTGPHDDRQSNGSVELRGWVKSQPHTTAYTSTLLRPRRPRIDGFNFAAALKECAPNTLYSMMNGLFCSAFRGNFYWRV